ncbi:unnamed protein product [Sphagnum jensenii]|uniref:Uncharacterized protein n=1 Tax=Sphagnum jensenii TaxID=128206 RepID=A0ABP0WGA1_9BRYO
MWCHRIRSELAGYKSYPPSTGSRPDGYGNSDYRLKLGCWHTHGLRACEIPPVHYVIMSGDVLWLTGYVR